MKMNYIISYRRIFIFISLFLLYFNIIELSACEKVFSDTLIESKLNNLKGKIKYLDQNIELNPTHATAYYFRGKYKIELIMYQLAISGFSYTAAKLDLKFPVSGTKNYYERKGEMKPFPSGTKNYQNALASAIRDFDKTIELNPHYAQAYYGRGNAKVMRDAWFAGNYYEAMEDMNKAIELNPRFADAYMDRGMIKVIMYMHDEAIADLTKAISLRPDFAPYYHQRGLAYLRSPESEAVRAEKAIRDFDKAIELNPHFAHAYYSRGNAYLDLGIAATNDYRIANKLNPNFPNEVPPHNGYPDFL